MAFSNYTEQNVLDHLFGANTFTKPASRFVALFTAAPGETGGGTEVAGNNYARVAAGNFTITAGNPSTAANSSTLEFPAATGSWGTVTHCAIFDASTSGNLLAYATLTTSRTVGSGDVLRFLTGELEITLD